MRPVRLSRVVLVALALVVALGSSCAVAGGRGPRYRIHATGYEYLDCSACVAFAEYLGRRMNKSLRFHDGGGSSVLATHRLDEDNKLKRHDYATSELRAAEVLDKLCSDALEENYVLRLNLDTRLRVYESEKSDLHFAQYYSLQDSRDLKMTAKRAVRSFCERAMGEEEEAMTALVRELRELRDVEWRLCGGDGNNTSTPPPGFTKAITDVCEDTEPSMELERQRIDRYEAWQNTFTKRREEAIEAMGGRSDEPVLLEPVEDAEPIVFGADDFRDL